MKIFGFESENENKRRLRNLLNSAKEQSCPTGWEKQTFAIGGLTEVGFSELNNNLLLIISSQGRGLIDCSTFEKISRDKDTGSDWINYQELWAKGIAEIKSEKVRIAGLNGGGLPLSNNKGDSLQMMAPDWPIIDLVFEPAFKSIYKDKEAKQCIRIFQDYGLLVWGFSSSGKHFIIVTSSEVSIFKKIAT